MQSQRADVVVIGAGFGGLSAALSLAERGARVVLCEALKYPGGCASTFSRAGYRFESGATLFSGFDPGQPFARWIDRHAMDVRVERLDPSVTLRTGALSLDVRASRASVIDALCAIEGAPSAKIRAFFDEQRAVADALWALFEDPALLPPLGPRSLWTHLGRTPKYLPVLRSMGRSMRSVLERHGLERFEPLRQYIDATLQITVQASAADAEAPFALSAMDYYFRGTGHVHGGIGALADAMVTAIRRLGGVVRLADRVRSIERAASGWRTHARRGVIESNAVVANVLPEALSTMIDVRSPALTALSQRVEQSWGAAMWYLGVRDDEPLGRAARHIECVDDPSQPLIEGNHVFISLSSSDERDRAPEGQRTVTCSTHVRAGALRSMREDEQRAYVERVQRRMRQTIARRAPEIAERVVMEMPASPRTFERFTGRPGGFVGGVPRRVGLAQYARLWPMEVERGLWLVGDSVGLGQSTLATAVTAMRTVEALARALPASSARRALPANTTSERETVRSSASSGS